MAIFNSYVSLPEGSYGMDGPLISSEMMLDDLWGFLVEKRWFHGDFHGLGIYIIYHNIPYPWPIEIDYKHMMIYRTCTWIFSIIMLNLPQGFGVIEPSNPAFTGPLLGI